MAYDENGNFAPDEQQQPDPEAAWNNASNQINKYHNDQGGGANIDWNKARSAWDQSGGDINKVYEQRNTWAAQPQSQAQQTAAAPAAWGKDSYENFRNEWLGQGFGNKANAGALESIAAKYGIKIDKGQHAFAPDGSYIGDMLGDVGGRNTVQFLRGSAGHATTDKLYGGKGKGGGKTPPGPGNKPPAGGGGAGGAGGGGGSTPPQSGAWGELYNQLMQRSNQGLNIDPNDPVIKAQTDAFRSEGTAQRRNFLADQAEGSGPYGNMRSEERRSAEQLGKSVGGLQAQLMGKELDARRQEIQNALSQRESMLTDEQRRALQLQLAKMDDATKRLGLSQQNSQFGQDLQYRYAGLNQADNQFRDRLGFDYGDRSNYWDAVNRGML